MESRAQALGHAIHPMLIPFPLGLLAAAVVFARSQREDFTKIRLMKGLLAPGSDWQRSPTSVTADLQQVAQKHPFSRKTPFWCT